MVMLDGATITLTYVHFSVGTLEWSVSIALFKTSTPAYNSEIYYQHLHLINMYWMRTNTISSSFSLTVVLDCSYSRFTKRTAVDNWSRFFSGQLPVSQPTVSKHWSECKAVMPTRESHPIGFTFAWSIYSQDKGHNNNNNNLTSRIFTIRGDEKIITLTVTKILLSHHSVVISKAVVPVDKPLITDIAFFMPTIWSQYTYMNSEDNLQQINISRLY